MGAERMMVNEHIKTRIVICCDLVDDRKHL